MTPSKNVASGQVGFTFDEYENFVSDVCNGKDPMGMNRLDMITEILMESGNAYVKDGKVDYGNSSFKALCTYLNDHISDKRPSLTSQTTFFCTIDNFGLAISYGVFNDYAEFESELRSSLIKFIDNKITDITPRIKEFSNNLSNGSMSLKEIYLSIHGEGNAIQKGAIQNINQGAGAGAYPPQYPNGGGMAITGKMPMREAVGRGMNPNVIPNPAMNPNIIPNPAVNPASGYNVYSGQQRNPSANQGPLKLVSNFVNTGGIFEIPLYSDRLVIGRNKDMSDFVIPGSNMISKRHCMILQQNGAYFVEDLNSSNGSRLNGNRLMANQKYAFKRVDVIRLADIDFNVV